jgi:hypothetical protein
VKKWEIWETSVSSLPAFLVVSVSFLLVVPSSGGVLSMQNQIYQSKKKNE